MKCSFPIFVNGHYYSCGHCRNCQSKGKNLDEVSKSKSGTR